MDETEAYKAIIGIGYKQANRGISMCHGVFAYVQSLFLFHFLEENIMKNQNVPNNPTHDMGDLVFQRAQKSWKKSQHFKDERVQGLQYRAQFDLIKELQAYLTTEQQETIPLWQLDDVLVNYVRNECAVRNADNAEAYIARIFALERFISYVKSAQENHNHSAKILVETQKACLRITHGTSDNAKKLFERYLKASVTTKEGMDADGNK